MNEGLRSLLSVYELRSDRDYENAFKEIIQEIALLGLWRAKFFEYAAFYGGSSLRILYELDRFSEDLDFSLLKPDISFRLDRFFSAIAVELKSFGFDIYIESVEKSAKTTIQSAFIKATTRKNMLVIRTPDEYIKRMHRERVMKVKFDIDIDPPGEFLTEAKIRMLPIPYSILTFKLPDLFAGKVHALIHRERKSYVKGRDWYDLVWFIARKTPLGLAHLKARLVQTGTWEKEHSLKKNDVVELLEKTIAGTDFESARKDVLRFVKYPEALDLWSEEFFLTIVSQLQTT
ncbi:MAG: nucleotidyl transferase AbiEii/AbiGii toxin family protein [Chitinispirillaceae bacterium]|nr:nucleotidyl transferase AbiEii/AbiGii toxin family protein [Chitinispirillaceae bacterium]